MRVTCGRPSSLSVEQPRSFASPSLFLHGDVGTHGKRRQLCPARDAPAVRGRGGARKGGVVSGICKLGRLSIMRSRGQPRQVRPGLPTAGDGYCEGTSVWCALAAPSTPQAAPLKTQRRRIPRSSAAHRRPVPTAQAVVSSCRTATVRAQRVIGCVCQLPASRPSGEERGPSKCRASGQLCCRRRMPLEEMTPLFNEAYKPAGSRPELSEMVCLCVGSLIDRQLVGRFFSDLQQSSLLGHCLL